MTVRAVPACMTQAELSLTLTSSLAGHRWELWDNRRVRLSPRSNAPIQRGYVYPYVRYRSCFTIILKLPALPVMPASVPDPTSSAFVSPVKRLFKVQRKVHLPGGHRAEDVTLGKSLRGTAYLTRHPHPCSRRTRHFPLYRHLLCLPLPLPLPQP